MVMTCICVFCIPPYLAGEASNWFASAQQVISSTTNTPRLQVISLAV